MISHTFHKNERLKSRKTIGKIFQEGQSFIAYPLRIAWVVQEDSQAADFPIQFTQSVPKRRYAKAAHRNRIRRKIREAYRLQKHELYQTLSDNNHGKKYALMVIYVGKEDLPYATILKATKKWMRSFVKKVLV